VLAGNVTGLSPQGTLNLAPGEAVAILGNLDGDAAKVRLRGTFQGEAVEKVYNISPKDVPKDATSLLANFWTRAEIENMHQAGEATDKVVAFSLEYGVMSPYTSFLVLENEEAYRRFNVERRKEAQKQREQEAEKELAQAQSTLEKSDDDLKDVLEGKAKK